MYAEVIAVKPLGEYKLILKFENNEERLFDVSPYLHRGKFAELRDLIRCGSILIRLSRRTKLIWTRNFYTKKTFRS